MTMTPNDGNNEQPRDLGMSVLCLGITGVILWLIWQLFTKSVGA